MCRASSSSILAGVRPGQTPAKSVSTLAKSISTVAKSVSTLAKSILTVAKSVSTLAKSISTLAKSVFTLPHSIAIFPNAEAWPNTKLTYKCYLSWPTLWEASYIPHPSPSGEGCQSQSSAPNGRGIWGEGAICRIC